MEPGFAGPNDNFIEQVRRALEHMYDLPFLQRHPLALSKGLKDGVPGETPGQRLRRMLVDAIETLNPGVGVFFRSPQARPYHMLHMHCIDGMSIADAARELGVSERQAYRDLRQGEETVIAVLWNRLKPDPTLEGVPVTPASASVISTETVQKEIDLLDATRQQVDLRDLLNRAAKSVEKLAEIQAVQISMRLPSEPVWLTVNTTGAQQLLVSLLSRVIQGISSPAPVRLSLQPLPGAGARLVLEYPFTAGEPLAFVGDALIAGLIYRLNWDFHMLDDREGMRQVELSMSPGKNIILVIDDNEGLLDLFARFMTGLDCQMVSARSGADGLGLALEVRPSAVILDVMMPDMDGWEILQRLRSDPRTTHIPVGICSVVDDPGLAYSLGASMLISKPVTREKVLSALRQLGLVSE